MQIEWLSRFFGRRRPTRRPGVRRSGNGKRRDPRDATEMLRTPPLFPADEPHAPPRPVASAPVFPPQPAAPPAAQPVPAPPPPRSPSALEPASAADPDVTQFRPSAAVHRAVVGVLVGIEGDHEGKTYAILDGENPIGRAHEARVKLEERDKSVSRQHAEIVHDEGAFLLRAVSETNPTWINDEPLESGAPLRDGDRIRMGQNSFRFRTA